jgi:hypothetical protein
VTRTSQLFAAYNALLAQVTTALPALAAVGAIYDGPQPTLATNTDLVFIGCDDPLSASTVLAIESGKQEWLDLGAFNKQETFTIMCSYVAWSGDEDLPGCRTRAAANIALIETQLRPNPTGGTTAPDGMLGTNGANGPLAPTGWCSLSLVRMQVVSSSGGPALHVLFQVECTTRI